MSAFHRDLNDEVGGDLAMVIGAVLVLAYLVLLVMLRSVLLPLKAVVMNLLSIGAAYGVVVAIFQWGWLDWPAYHHLGDVEDAHAAAGARDHVRPLDGLRGVPAVADQERYERTATTRAPSPRASPRARG